MTKPELTIGEVSRVARKIQCLAWFISINLGSNTSGSRLDRTAYSAPTA